jgi:hypothetical protein
MAVTQQAQSERIVGESIGRSSVSFGGSYLLMVVPPKSDGEYAALATGTSEDANPPEVPTGYESRDALLEAGRNTIESWRAKHGSYGGLPDPPPVADNIVFATAPAFAEELTLRDFFGDASLGQFDGGSSSSTRMEEQCWAEQTDIYEEWLQPLEDHDGLVLQGVLDGSLTGTDHGQHLWIRHTEANGIEILSRDGSSFIGPEPADLTKLVRWLGDFWRIDKSFVTSHYQLEANTPFGRSWRYESLPKHPKHVAGWRWRTDRRAWIHSDGHCEVHLGPGYFDVRDRRQRDMGGRVESAGYATSTDANLPADDLREQALEWMQENPADEWDHPLRPLFDAADEYGGPAGYRPLSTHRFRGRLTGGGYAADRATLCYKLDVDDLSWRETLGLFIIGDYQPGSAPNDSANGPWTVKFTTGRTPRSEPIENGVVKEIGTFAAACEVATSMAE